MQSSGPYNGFEVMSHRSIVLVKNTIYCVQAEETGYLIRPGVMDLNTVLCSGVTFAFEHQEYWRNKDGIGSSSSEGRISELFFFP